MLLFELEADPMTIRMVAVTSQLTSEIESGEKKGEWTVDHLLKYYYKNDIMIDKSDLYDAIKKPPLNKFISNIKGDKVIFKGQEEEVNDIKPDENKKIVSNMAKKAIR